MSNTNSNGQHKTAGRMRDLIEGFDALALRLQGKPRPSEPPAQPLYPASGNSIYTDAAGNRSQYPYPTHANGGFVGGFRPKPTMPPATPPRTHAYSGPPGYEPLPPLPRPPTMPKPHHSPMSLTMQHALHGMPTPDPSHSNLAPPPILLQCLYSDPEVPSKSDGKGKRKTDGPHTPQPIKIAAPINRRTNSAPSSPTGSASGSGVGDRPVQCAGITNAGQRCKKMVRVNSAKAATETDTFCHQHEKKMREPSGFYDRKTGKTFIKFDDYIPPYLQRSTQASLRSEMQKALSEKDEDGYIYAFEILDDSDKNVVHLKVGRAVNLNARMDQWQRQCSSKENVLRGYWPDGMEANQPTMRGLIEAGRKGPWCHRVERLVHLELADLATYTPYMDNKFPKCEPPIADGDAATRKQAKADVKRCPDCGKTHKEIFTFERVKRGPYQGKEWTSIVSSVIKKWGEFVEAYL